MSRHAPHYICTRKNVHIQQLIYWALLSPHTTVYNTTAHLLSWRRRSPHSYIQYTLVAHMLSQNDPHGYVHVGGSHAKPEWSTRLYTCWWLTCWAKMIHMVNGYVHVGGSHAEPNWSTRLRTCWWLTCWAKMIHTAIYTWLTCWAKMIQTVIYMWLTCWARMIHTAIYSKQETHLQTLPVGLEDGRFQICVSVYIYTIQ